jgi:hypothetical protein
MDPSGEEKIFWDICKIKFGLDMTDESNLVRLSKYGGLHALVISDESLMHIR